MLVTWASHSPFLDLGHLHLQSGCDMMDEVKGIVEKFDELQQDDLDKAVKFVTRNSAAFEIVTSCLREQVPGAFFQPLFEWLYKCVQLRSASNQLYYFCLQFIPDLVVIYLNAVYDDLTPLKANTEALLIAIMAEEENEKSQTLLQVPTLSKSSLYHQCPSQLSQPVLTEAVLQRHNEVETVSKQPEFTGKPITVNNRLDFLSSIVDVFCDHVMLFGPETRTSFCQSCIRLALQGMGTLGSHLDQFRSSLSVDLAAMRRLSVSDSIIRSLLRGVRTCLFQSCHDLATQALTALKLRAEYELLTESIQISCTLSRLAESIQPQELKLDVKEHSRYYGAGSPDFDESPVDMHTSMNCYILHHNLSASNPAVNGKDTVYSKSTAV